LSTIFGVSWALLVNAFSSLFLFVVWESSRQRLLLRQPGLNDNDETHRGWCEL
jgi:hypothetical protein